MDKYDKQITHLTENPGDIEKQWGDGIGLFAFATRNKDNITGRKIPGCLTIIRSGYPSYGVGQKIAHLAGVIRADDRLPSDPYQITVESLPVFAEWQRKIDAVYGIVNESL